MRLTLAISRKETFKTGVWGHRSFENDDALDWAASLGQSKDTALIADTLRVLNEEEADYPDAPECAAALAAAEAVAALNGKPASSLPEEVTTWVHGRSAPDPELLSQARNAVDIIRADSELKDLWQASPREYSRWCSEIDGLRNRLL
jgi:hypothetical protein